MAVSAVLVALGAFGAQAQGEAPSGVAGGGGGRYALSPVPGGALRLDTATGAVSFCRVEPGRADGEGLACRLVPSERDALSAEIDRLTAENKRLREQLAGGAPRPRDALPSEEEVDKALGLMERFLRRFLGILKDETPGPSRPL